MKNSIACQVHISNESHQGDGLGLEEKKKVVELSLEHLRHQNPDTYIAVSIRGESPSSKILDFCDYVFIAPLGARAPAQYDSVHYAVDNCKSQGYDTILKLRADGIYGIKNFADYCDKIIEDEDKDLLVTQMTANKDYKLGDCTIHGKTDVISYLWSKFNPERHWDGLVHLGMNLNVYYSSTLEWMTLLRKHCAFRNISTLQWMDLRYNYGALNSLGWENVREHLLNDQFDLEPYYWGRNNGWHKFENNKMVYSIEPYYLEEETFYENI